MCLQVLQATQHQCFPVTSEVDKASVPGQSFPMQGVMMRGTLLQAAASVWPEGRPPQVLRYENGRLSLGAPGIGADEISRMKATLEPAGWRIDQTDNQVTLSRPTTPGAAR